MLALLMLDVHRSMRRMISRSFLRLLLGVLSLGLLAMVISSFYALQQVSRSMESLVGDSMIGVEAAVSMRAAVRETQIELLRIQITRGGHLPAADIAVLGNKMSELLRNYRVGVFVPEDEANAVRIEQRLALYIKSLQPISQEAQPVAADARAADQAAKELVDAIESAYQFNRIRIHTSADEVSNAVERALTISNRLLWSFALFAVLALLIYLAYRWAALPEEGNG